MIAKHELEMDILIECEKQKIDEYYKKLRSHGWFDFVDDFIEPRFKIEGIRIDKSLNYPMTIRTNKIVCENTLSILGQVKSLRDTCINL
tara:strand:- start:221 stop:487 length:267 start_codon:yes stop_codon:yes gene_type:complete